MNKQNQSPEIPETELPDFDAVKKEFTSGAIFALSDDDLARRNAMLVNLVIPNENVRHQPQLMSDAIHSILYARILRNLVEENKKSQQRYERLAIFVAVAIAAVELLTNFVRP